MKALITGVNSEMNKTLLGSLVDAGYEIVAQYHSNNDLSREVMDKYPNVTFVQADFQDKTSFDGFLKGVEGGAPYDVVVNAAVYYAESGDNWEEVQKDWQEWQNNFLVNTTVPGLLMARADKLVADQGVVVNISSSMGQKQFGDMQFNMYGASKSALDLLTNTFAKRWSPRIRVVGIAPGYVHSAWNMDMDEVDLKNIKKDQLTNRLVEPAEIAELMMEIIRNQSINATTIVIDGGYSAPKIG